MTLNCTYIEIRKLEFVATTPIPLETNNIRQQQKEWINKKPWNLRLDEAVMNLAISRICEASSHQTPAL